MSNSVYDSILLGQTLIFPKWTTIQCLKIAQVHLKIPKMDGFGELLKTSSLRSNSVTRQASFNKKSKCDILGDFQTLCTNQSSK